MNQLVIFHKFKPAAVDSAVIPMGCVEFKSCLRQILFLNPEAFNEVALNDSYQRFEGHEAYGFLLEVICGLHSPLVGETEILGQFKAFIEANSHSLNSLKRIFKDILRDAKAIRRDCLLDLGSQSYGSVLRKITGSGKKIAIVGGGKLAQEIIPWLAKDSNDLFVYVRNLASVQFEYEKTHPLAEINLRQFDFIILAAPISALSIENLLLDSATQLIDLRGEGRNDPLTLKNVINLDEVFLQIEKSKKQAEFARQKAIIKVNELAEKRSLSEKSRPFGWEDIYYFGNCVANK